MHNSQSNLTCEKLKGRIKISFSDKVKMETTSVNIVSVVLLPNVSPKSYYRRIRIS